MICGFFYNSLMRLRLSEKQLSVHSQPEDIARAMQSGADAFVQKGSPYNSLFESIIQNKPVKGEKK
jgi:hypothetical protein